MKLDTACPGCGEKLAIDSGYLGTKRTCTACGAKFLFEMQAEDGSGTLDASSFGRPKVGCTSCFRISEPKGIYQNAASFPCGYCGAILDRGAAEAYVAVINAMTEKARLGLLAGQGEEAVARGLMQEGLTREDAMRLVEQMHEKLPFMRFEVFDGEDQRVMLGAPPECDLCRCGLQPIEQREAHRTLWRKQAKNDDEMERHRGLAGLVIAAIMYFGARAITNTDSTIEETALYYLCQDCRKGLDRTFGGYAGYPVTTGFHLVKVQTVHGMRSR